VLKLDVVKSASASAEIPRRSATNGGMGHVGGLVGLAAERMGARKGASVSTRIRSAARWRAAAWIVVDLG